jgi:hypothetical protein
MEFSIIFFHFINTWNVFPESPMWQRGRCRRPIKMSPLCHLQMTLPGGFQEGVKGDGSADERWGLTQLEVLRDLDQRRLTTEAAGTAAGARTPPAIPAVEGVPARGSGGPDLEATRSPQQPAQARSAAESGAGDHPRVVLGFRPNIGGREAARGARDHARPRDAPALDDLGWDLG